MIGEKYKIKGIAQTETICHEFVNLSAYYIMAFRVHCETQKIFVK